MQRHFFARGKKVLIKEIPDVVAVHFGGGERVFPESLGQAVTLDDAGDSEQAREQQAFQNAGWSFIKPTEEFDLASNREAENISVGRVFRQENGRTLIGTNRLTVQLRPELSEQDVLSLLAANQLEIANKLGFGKHLYEVKVSSERDFLDAANELQEHSDFLFAEPQFIEQISSRFKPTDPDYNKQWQWKNDGSSGGVAGADVHAEEAWDTTRGSGIRVAVIDNGFEVSHPDFEGAIVEGAGYFKQQGAAETVFVSSLTEYPNSHHGTFCAGIAIARANNNTGGCGLANMAQFIPIAALQDQVGTQVTLARAISYAADPSQEHVNVAGADVISCSLGPSSAADWNLTSTLDLAIRFAVTNGRNGLGTPIFWAVSNGNVPIALDEVCSHPDTIAVGRSNRKDKEDGSAFGPKLDFLATGVNVLSTTLEGGYSTGTGTSYAAPCAAGLGALVLSVNPNLNYQQVREVIKASCDKIGGVSYDANGHHDKYGSGRINASSAVIQARSSVEKASTNRVT